MPSASKQNCMRIRYRTPGNRISRDTNYRYYMYEILLQNISPVSANGSNHSYKCCRCIDVNKHNIGLYLDSIKNLIKHLTVLPRNTDHGLGVLTRFELIYKRTHFYRFGSYPENKHYFCIVSLGEFLHYQLKRCFRIFSPFKYSFSTRPSSLSQLNTNSALSICVK